MYIYVIMSTISNIKTILIIVESPAKCKTIEKILGCNYKCIATCGHLRELSSLQDIDINNNFNPTYSLSLLKTRKKQ